MISTESANKLPGKVTLYYFVKFCLPIVIASLLFGLVFKSIGAGIGLFVTLFVFIVTPVFILIKLSLNRVSFSLDPDSITTHSGIFNKKTRVVPFPKIQSVDCVSGPLLGFFDLSVIRVWTASPAQVTVERGESSAFAEIELTLDTKDAELLLNQLVSGKKTNEQTPIYSWQQNVV